MKNIKLAVILLSLTLIFSQASQAALIFDPSTSPLGARPVSLGGAFIGEANDANAVFYNPAGIASINKWSLTSMYTNLLEKIGYTMIGGTYRTNFGTLGAGYIGTTAPAGYATGASTTEIGGPISFNTHTFVISYATELGRIPRMNSIPVIPRQTLIGANLKLLSQGFSGDGAGGKSGFGYNIDLGAISRIKPWLKAGLTLTNILPNSMSWASGASEAMPTRISVGGSFNIIDKDGSALLRGTRPLTGLIDASIGFAREDGISMRGGLEWEAIEQLKLRCGLEQVNASTGDGQTGIAMNASLGVGFLYKGWSFDYAYKRDMSIDANQAHFFSLSYAPEVLNPVITRMPARIAEVEKKAETNTVKKAPPKMKKPVKKAKK